MATATKAPPARPLPEPQADDLADLAKLMDVLFTEELPPEAYEALQRATRDFHSKVAPGRLPLETLEDIARRFGGDVAAGRFVQGDEIKVNIAKKTRNATVIGRTEDGRVKVSVKQGEKEQVVEVDQEQIVV